LKLKNKIKKNITKLISYVKTNPTTTFIQLLRTKEFKNKIKNKYNEKKHKKEEKIKILP
jgi:hypothetical protein